MADKRSGGHAGYDTVSTWPRATLPDGTEVTVVRLIAGESAWSPAWPNSAVWGPARVDYFWHPDGGVTAQVSDLDRDF